MRAVSGVIAGLGRDLEPLLAELAAWFDRVYPYLYCAARQTIKRLPNTSSSTPEDANAMKCYGLTNM